MQPQKRDWIFDGLAHPEGIALAIPITSLLTEASRVHEGSTMLLAGDAHVRGLAPTLSRLCGGKRVDLKVRYMPPPVCKGELLKAAQAVMEQATMTEADTVLVSLPWSSPFSAYELFSAAHRLSRLREKGRTVVWLRPPCSGADNRTFKDMLDRASVPSFHSELLELPMGPDGVTPTALGYAAWAGGLWRWMR